LTREEVPGGVLERWISGKVPAMKYPNPDDLIETFKHAEPNI